MRFDRCREKKKKKASQILLSDSNQQLLRKEAPEIPVGGRAAAGTRRGEARPGSLLRGSRPQSRAKTSDSHAGKQAAPITSSVSQKTHLSLQKLISFPGNALHLVTWPRSPKILIALISDSRERPEQDVPKGACRCGARLGLKATESQLRQEKPPKQGTCFPFVKKILVHPKKAHLRGGSLPLVTGRRTD